MRAAPEVLPMFQGRWPNSLTIDGKNRLALPARFRVGLMDQEGNAEFMVGVLNSPCLYLHTPEQRAPRQSPHRHLYRAIPEHGPCIYPLQRRAGDGHGE